MKNKLFFLMLGVIVFSLTMVYAENSFDDNSTGGNFSDDENDNEDKFEINAETNDGKSFVKIELEYFTSLEGDAVYDELLEKLELNSDVIADILKIENSLEPIDDERQLKIEIDLEDNETEVDFEFKFVVESDKEDDIVSAIVNELDGLTVEILKNGLEEGDSDETDDDEDEDSDDDGIDDKTENESVEMNSEHGARMRMLQLERAIRIRILWGTVVVEHLQNTNGNFTRLSEILSELELLADEASGVVDGAIDNLTVQNFIGIKKESKILIKEFKEIARELINEEDKVSLRLRFKEIDRENLQELKEKIREKQRKLNAERTRKILEDIGEEDEELIEEISEGRTSREEIVEKIRQKHVLLNEETKIRLKERLKEEVEERKLTAKRKVLESVDNGLDRVQNRLREKADNLRREAVR